MKATLPSLKSRFSRLVIKIWEAMADMSIQRHATFLIMYFNHHMEREQPTLGSLSTSHAPNGRSEESPIKSYIFWPRSDYVMKSEGHCWMDWAERDWVWLAVFIPKVYTYTVTCMHIALCTHALKNKTKKKQARPSPTAINNVFLFNLLS